MMHALKIQIVQHRSNHHRRKVGSGSARSCPQTVIDEQRTNRLPIIKDILKWIRENLNFLSNIIIEDET